MNNQKETFEYAYSSKRQMEVEKIRKKYLTPEEDKMELLRKLDKSVETPGMVAGIVLGVIGCLILGTGMSCIMVWSDTLFILGIIVGTVGLALVAAAYPVYSRITRKQRKKLAPRILELTEELLQ